jgi:hypothetical protein
MSIDDVSNVPPDDESPLINDRPEIPSDGCVIADLIHSAWSAVGELNERANRLAYEHPEGAWSAITFAESIEEVTRTFLFNIIRDTDDNIDASESDLSGEEGEQ